MSARNVKERGLAPSRHCQHIYNQILICLNTNSIVLDVTGFKKWCSHY